MNAPFDPSNMQSFGSPPAPASGLRRLTPVLKAATAGSVIIMAGMYAAQVLLPARLTPATVTGTAAGQTEAADIDMKAKTKTAYEAGLAEAAAQPQARSQIEIETNRQQQQARTDSLGVQIAEANVVDLACAIGIGIASLAGPDNAQLREQAGDVAHLTCGAGDVIRQNITQQQAEAARTGGAVITRNIYGQVSAPDPVPVPHKPGQTTASAAEGPSHHYSHDELLQIYDYMLSLPLDIRKWLTAGLPDDATQLDVLGDRVFIYAKTHDRHTAG